MWESFYFLAFQFVAHNFYIFYLLFVAANLADTQSDLAMYIGITVAVFVVTLLSFFLVRVYRKKGQHQSLYSMAANGKLYFDFYTQ